MSGRIVVTEFVSVDGVMEDPGGSENFEHGGWSFEYNRGDEGDKFKMEELMDAEVQLLGRVTYEGFAEAWPSREGEFADKINKGRKVLVSTTLTDPSWENTTVISENVPEELRKLRDETDGNILVAGSNTLVHTLFENDLVDELRLMVFPTVLGSGKRLYPRRDRPAQAEARQGRGRRPGRRPGAGLPARRLGGREDELPLHAPGLEPLVRLGGALEGEALLDHHAEPALFRQGGKRLQA